MTCDCKDCIARKGGGAILWGVICILMTVAAIVLIALLGAGVARAI